MRSRRAVLLAVAATAACATVTARPEDPIPVEVDQRVRVTLSSRAALGPLQGTVVSVSPDTLVVAREEGGVRRLSRNQIDEIEVSLTRTRDPVSAAGYGILAGAPLLIPLIILAPLVAYESKSGAVGIVLVPIAALAGIGAAIGSGPQDVWVDASWDATGAPTPADSLPTEDQ